jgi:hypothetical protein
MVFGPVPTLDAAAGLEVLCALALETVITQLVVRSPGSDQNEPEPDKKITPAPIAKTSDKPESNVDTGPAPSDIESESIAPRRVHGQAREVRHVAVVTLRLHGIERFEALLEERAMKL